MRGLKKITDGRTDIATTKPVKGKHSKAYFRYRN